MIVFGRLGEVEYALDERRNKQRYRCLGGASWKKIEDALDEKYKIQKEGI